MVVGHFGHQSYLRDHPSTVQYCTVLVRYCSARVCLQARSVPRCGSHGRTSSPPRSAHPRSTTYGYYMRVSVCGCLHVGTRVGLHICTPAVCRRLVRSMRDAMVNGHSHPSMYGIRRYDSVVSQRKSHVAEIVPCQLVPDGCCGYPSTARTPPHPTYSP